MNSVAPDSSPEASSAGKQGSLGFRLYQVFVVSWFLHLAARVPILGAIHFDILLVAMAGTAIFLGQKTEGPASTGNQLGKILFVLGGYILLTLPFVQFPGSVLNRGLETFVKAAIFYFFTVGFVVTETRLKAFMLTFLGCQSFRVLEPVYLHLTVGYWGDRAYMSGENLNRLAGAPSDIINPNGLAFVVVTVLPFLFFLSRSSRVSLMVSLILAPPLLYALMLTGSRSGVVAVAVMAVGIMFKSKHKLGIAILLGILGVIMFIRLDPAQKDRYLSIISNDTKNSATASGRFEGLQEDFRVALNKPIFGHGISTSREANFNFGHSNMPSHNLYIETIQEIGFVGLGIFLWFIVNILKNLWMSMIYLRSRLSEINYLIFLTNALQIWLLVNIAFSFVSYGLTGYEWYLQAGLSVVLRKLTESPSEATPVPERA
jgi:putative inorganic carbon (hco3(-)) transporter